PKTSPLETQSVSGGRLLELPFMFCSGVRWSFSFWLNVFVWVVTLWLWIIAPVTFCPKTLFFILCKCYSLFLTVTLNFQIIAVSFFGFFICSVNLFAYRLQFLISFNQSLAFLLQFSFDILIFLVFLNA